MIVVWLPKKLLDLEMLQDKSFELGFLKLNYFTWNTIDGKTYGCEFFGHLLA